MARYEKLRPPTEGEKIGRAGDGSLQVPDHPSCLHRGRRHRARHLARLGARFDAAGRVLRPAQDRVVPIYAGEQARSRAGQWL
jgi:hypothetical protein